MAPHGRPKLKRPPRADLQDVGKMTENESLAVTESTSRHRSSEVMSEPRVKTPTSDQNSTQMSSKSPKAKTSDSEGRASPEPNCAICLGKLRNKSFTDSCLHQFCFKCLEQWSKVKPECPLCKQSFTSIIHNVRSNEDYDQYHCKPQPTSTRGSLINELLSLTPAFSRFRYRTTQVSGSRRNETTVHELLLQQEMPYVITPSPPRWSARIRSRQMFPPDVRATVYTCDMWVRDRPDYTGRYRESTPQFFRMNPAQLHRLVPWLLREIPIVTQNNNTNPQVIIDLILSLITEHHIQSRVMISRLRPFFGVRTAHFLHEFNAFARSPYDLIGFDHSARYGPNPNPTVFTPDTEDPVQFSDSDNSDVIILESDVESVAGPSSSRRRPYSVIVPAPTSSTASTLETPLLLDDSDDCEIVGYVKPRHERTPEIIVLSDTDGESGGNHRVSQKDEHLWNRLQQVNESLNEISNILSPNSPFPSCPYLISSNSSCSSPTSLTSEYTPYTLRSSAKKLRKKRSKASRTERKKSSTNKPPKTRTQPGSSDSNDEGDSLRKSSSRKQHDKSSKRRDERTRRNSYLSSSSESNEPNQPGPSGLNQKRFSNLLSTRGHSNSIPLERDNVMSASDNGDKKQRSSSQRTKRVKSISSGCEENGADVPGPSGLGRRRFSSHDSTSSRSNSLLLKEGSVNSYSEGDSKSGAMKERLSSKRSSLEHPDCDSKGSTVNLNIKFGYTSPHDQASSSALSEGGSSSLNQEQNDSLEVRRDTWCIKQSISDHEETSEDDTSQYSSSSEYRPKLKSIVIMRTNNSNNLHNQNDCSLPAKEYLRSDSPIASTSRAGLQSPTASLSSRAYSQSPSKHSKSSPIPSFDSSHNVYKSKYQNKTRLRSKSRSQSSSSNERKVKKSRTSKWDFEYSDDSS